MQLPNEHQIEPWDSVNVDLIGPWEINFKLTGTRRVSTEKIKAQSVVDKTTGWTAVAYITNKRRKNIT